MRGELDVGIMHIVCKGCKWNNYPTCNGLIFDGIPMNIENLKPLFICGTKDEDTSAEFKPTKSILETKITDLENEVVSIMNQEENCDDGQVPKRDSFSDTGWSCQDDETGDGGGGTPGDPLDEIKLMPLPTFLTTCSEANAGIIYYQKDPEPQEPDKVCVCIDRDDDIYAYADLLTNSPC